MGLLARGEESESGLERSAEEGKGGKDTGGEVERRGGGGGSERAASRSWDGAGSQASHRKT